MQNQISLKKNEIEKYETQIKENQTTLMFLHNKLNEKSSPFANFISSGTIKDKNISDTTKFDEEISKPKESQSLNFSPNIIKETPQFQQTFKNFTPSLYKEEDSIDMIKPLTNFTNYTTQNTQSIQQNNVQGNNSNNIYSSSKPINTNSILNNKYGTKGTTMNSNFGSSLNSNPNSIYNTSQNSKKNIFVDKALVEDEDQPRKNPKKNNLGAIQFK